MKKMKSLLQRHRCAATVFAAAFCTAVMAVSPMGRAYCEEPDVLLIQPEPAETAEAVYGEAAVQPAEAAAAVTEGEAAVPGEPAPGVTAGEAGVPGELVPGTVAEEAVEEIVTAEETQGVEADSLPPSADMGTGAVTENVGVKISGGAAENAGAEIPGGAAENAGTEVSGTAESAGAEVPEEPAGGMPADSSIEIIGIEEVTDALEAESFGQESPADPMETGSLEQAEYGDEANPYAGAAAILLDNPYNGSISAAVPENYYSFTLTQSGILKLSARSGDIAAMNYAVCSVQGNTIWSTDAYMDSKTGLNSRGDEIVMASGTYYLVVKQLKDSAGTYTFTLSNNALEESFPESDGGLNNTLETASPIEPGVTYTAQIAWNDNTDTYKFTVASASLVTFTNSNAGAFRYLLWDEAGNKLSEDSHFSADDIAFSRHLTMGTYYFQVARVVKTGSYRLTLSVEPDADMFPETSGGSNNTLPAASAVRLNRDYSFQIAMNDGWDFFKFTVPRTQKITVTCSSNQMIWDLYDEYGQKMLEKDMTWASVLGGWPVDQELSAGTYYLSVMGRGALDEGSHQFKISGYQPESAQISVIENTSKGVRLTWNAVPNATGYKVFRKKSGGSYELIKTVKSGTSVRYTDQKAVNGGVYYYRLRTLEGDSYSVLSTTKKIARLDLPQISSLKNQQGGIAVVKIKKNRKATGYQVMYDTSSRFNNSRVKKVTGLTYNIRNLRKGNYCCVRVRSYKKVNGKNYYSAWSKTVKVKILK